ncbi:hypothetical protein [Glycomyces sp. NPDC048151]|uniref:hypothetical protein n=1 Tax=Glycomyces sp. NPDC048151 TaxID=3364002 RepID=UPI00371B421E
MTGTKDAAVRSAARNNAECCAAMCRSHGMASEFRPTDWTAPVRTPLFYPDAVTLAPGADASALVSRIDTAAPGASVKDSFADLDLSGAGFAVLFEAQWIRRPAGAPATAPGLDWSVVEAAGPLREWALAWDGGDGHADLFGPALLEDEDTYVLAGRSKGGPVAAGAVANRSGDVIGVSNVFTNGAASAWPGVLALLDRLFPDLPLVGYEHGDDLAAALGAGFEPIGPLRVWLHQGTEAGR